MRKRMTSRHQPIMASTTSSPPLPTHAGNKQWSCYPPTEKQYLNMKSTCTKRGEKKNKDDRTEGYIPSKRESFGEGSSPRAREEIKR